MSAPPLFPALILAGGRSQRMGRNKALEPFGPGTLIAHIVAHLSPQAETVAVNAEGDWAAALGLPLVPDRIAGHAGPLAGIAAGLVDVADRMPWATHLLTVPADSPFFPADLAARLAAALVAPGDIAIARSDGRAHPVFGLWPVALAADLDAWLADPANRKVGLFLERHATRPVDFAMLDTAAGRLDPFFNVNTPDELARARRFLDGLGR